MVTGTWLLFSQKYWGCHHPNWLICFRGIETTNQFTCWIYDHVQLMYGVMFSILYTLVWYLVTCGNVLQPSWSRKFDDSDGISSAAAWWLLSAGEMPVTFPSIPQSKLCPIKAAKFKNCLDCWCLKSKPLKGSWSCQTAPQFPVDGLKSRVWF